MADHTITIRSPTSFPSPLSDKTNSDFSTPVHVHHIENECFYAIEGEYEVKVGEETFPLRLGGSVYAPRLIPHAIHSIDKK